MSLMTKPRDQQVSTAPLDSAAQMRWHGIVVLITLGVIILDQITKALVVAHFTGAHRYDIVPVIDHLVTFEYVQNTGAAFSSFTHSPALLAVLILIALGVIGWLYWSTRERAIPALKIVFGLILGGALSNNLLDRPRLGYVVDFVHFQIPAIHFDFAVFNLADACISLGVIALALIFWVMPRETPNPEVASPSGSSAASSVEIPPPITRSQQTGTVKATASPTPRRAIETPSASARSSQTNTSVARSSSASTTRTSSRTSSKKRKRR